MNIFRGIAPALVFSLLIGSIAMAQEEKYRFEDLPKAVQKTVKTKYPDAKIRGVGKEKNDENETVYEVEMTIKGKAVDIIVDKDGDIETIEEELEISELPKAVKAVATETFPKGKITKAEKITGEDKVANFEVVIKVGDKEPFEVLMAKDGKILKDGSKPSTKKEKEEDDDEKEEKPEKKKPKA